MTKVKKISILGVNGFPYGSARIEKLKLIGKALILAETEVNFICNSWGNFKKNQIPVAGIFEGINYYCTCGLTYRPKNFFHRRWVNFKGKLGEIKFLLSNKCDVAIVSVASGMFFNFFYYWVLAKITGFRIFYPHHEEPSATLNKKNWYHRFNLYLFNKYGWKMMEGVFPVSTYLEGRIHQYNPKLPSLIIPALADFDFFNEVKKTCKNTKEKYFMYCGSLAYYEIIEFIIKAYETISDSEYNLHLVVYGNNSAVEKLRKRIEQSVKKDQIFIFRHLEYKLLVKKYISASALLIPLRITIQDKARFPHKIGEYAASGNPILTNKVGDLSFYFKNKKDALLAEDYNEKEFSKLMNYIVTNSEEAQKIGEEGYKTGSNLFDYKNYGKRIKNFIELTTQ